MPLEKKKNFWSVVKDYFLVTLGIFLYVLAWAMFLIPNNLIGGGVSGIASMLQYATGIKMGYFYFAINAVLLLIGFLVLGPKFGSKTVYAIIIASIGLNVLQDIIPKELSQALAVDNGKLMSTMIGGILTGIGIGTAMKGGGSSGGTDIIALIISRYRSVSPGKLILWMDVIIITLSLLLPSYTADGQVMPFTEKITVVVYGLVLVTINGYAIDLYLSGSRQSMQIFIFSKKYEEIADEITQELHRGVTVLPAQGWYTKKESKVLMVVVRKTDLNVVFNYIKAIDPDAFMSVGSVTGVYGNGFDRIKGLDKKMKQN